MNRLQLSRNTLYHMRTKLRNRALFHAVYLCVFMILTVNSDMSLFFFTIHKECVHSRVGTVLLRTI